MTDHGAPTDPPEPADPVAADPFEAIVGQEAAVAQLRAAARNPVHAYLLVGPPGSGQRQAALALAGELVAEGARAAGDAAAVARHRRLAAAEAHPDITTVEREGPFITRDQARAVVTQSVRSPMEGARRVLVLSEFHLVLDAAPVLLKAVEEPPASTVFLILADEITPELVTIASRCVLVQFARLDPSVVAQCLEVEGVEPLAAQAAAQAAGGDLGRARILANDPELGGRMQLWADVPTRLDGSGAAVVRLAEDVLAALDQAFTAIDARHQAESAELAAREARYGVRAPVRALQERQRRERRRFRSDELRFGLAVLARTYRDRLADHLQTTRTATAPASAADLRVFEAIQQAAEAIERNPNERLLLERLFVGLLALR